MLERGRVVVLLDRLQQQVLEPFVDLQIAEDVVDLLAVQGALLFDLGEQPFEYLAFAGAVCDEVPQVADLGLADAMDALSSFVTYVLEQGIFFFGSGGSCDGESQQEFCGVYRLHGGALFQGLQGRQQRRC